MLEICTEDDFQCAFPDEVACEQQLYHLKWPTGFICPNCGHHKARKISTRKVFECTACGHQPSLTANTLMHRTRLPLLKWFIAIFLVIRTLDGISAKKLQSKIGVSYPTAWYLLHRIRKAMDDPLQGIPLHGLIATHTGSVAGVVDRGYWHAQHDALEPIVTVKYEQKPALSPIPVPENTDTRDRIILMVGMRTDTTQLSSAEAPKEEQNTLTPLNPAQSVLSCVRGWLARVFRCAVGRHLQHYLDEFAYRFNHWVFQEQLLALVATELMTHPPLFYHRLVGRSSRKNILNSLRLHGQEKIKSVPIPQ